MGQVVDLTGIEFGRLTVVERCGRDNRGEAMWLCVCECGKERKIRGSSLRVGLTKSCGCLNKEIVSKNSKTHGRSNSALHNVWRKMKQRCFSEKDQAFKYYGGRGITVCDEWKDNFENFYKCSMTNGYSDGLTLDRINVNGNYEPSNCRWVTMKVQQNNRRNNRRIEFNGQVHTITEWSVITGINLSTISMRLKKGWSAEKTLTTGTF